MTNCELKSQNVRTTLHCVALGIKFVLFLVFEMLYAMTSPDESLMEDIGYSILIFEMFYFSSRILNGKNKTIYFHLHIELPKLNALGMERTSSKGTR